MKEQQMSDFNLEEEYNETGSANDLRVGGFYDVEVKHVSINKKDNGVTEWSVTVNAGGEYDDTLYNFATKFASGKDFGINAVLRPLFDICGVKNQVIVPKTVKTKDGTTEIQVYEGFGGQKIKIAVRRKWNSYHKKFDSKLVRVASEDGRTATEIKNGETAGTQFLKQDITDVLSDRNGSAPAAGAAAAPEGASAADQKEADDAF